MKYKEKRVYKHLPDGWKIDEDAIAHPTGTKWITNGKSRFPKNGKPSEHRQALLVTDEKLMIERMAINRRTGKTDGFVTDKTTEAKVQAEIRRQKRRTAQRIYCYTGLSPQVVEAYPKAAHATTKKPAAPSKKRTAAKTVAAAKRNPAKKNT